MQITFQSPIVLGRVNENSTFTLTARFWDDSADAWAATTPTTIRYRVDCATTGRVMLDWTSVTAASEISLTINVNSINEPHHVREWRQVTVEADHGLSTQYLDTFTYSVENIGAI